MLWGVWLLLPVGLLADSHQLESFLCLEPPDSNRSEATVQRHAVKADEMLESQASVTYHSKSNDFFWEKRAKRVHPLDRLVLDADHSRQTVEDEINLYIKRVFPRRVSAELAPGSSGVHLLMVIQF